MIQENENKEAHMMEGKEQNQYKKFEINPIVLLKTKYETDRPLFERVVRFVISEFVNYFDDIHADYIHSIKGRVKEFQSIVEKMFRIHTYAISKVKDICGVRIVCLNECDKVEISSFINENKNFNVLNEVLTRKDDSYSGLHIKLNAKITHKGLASWYPVEIQIRTLAEEYFAVKSHREVYKLNANFPRSFLNEMRMLREKIDKLETASGKLRDKWEQFNMELPFPKHRYLKIKTIKEIIKKEMNIEISNNEAYKIYKPLLYFGMDKTETLKTIIGDEELNKRFENLKNKNNIKISKKTDEIFIKMFLFATTDEIALNIASHYVKLL